MLRSKKNVKTLQEQKEHEKQNVLQTEIFEKSETSLLQYLKSKKRMLKEFSH